MNLALVVSVDPQKCVNCHACIAVCPVKYCNDGSGDSIEINPSLCIGCGQCLEACTHGARRGVDDAAVFFHEVGHRPYVAVAAPAVASSFPGQALRLNGWLKSLGVDAVFDVSFGAELTVKSYLEHLKDHPGTLIAQPCPALVTYVQLHRPELLPHLAPADSPMAHTIRMIRRFFPEYQDHRIVVLSPCVAKRREFDELGWKDEVRNLTYRSLADHLEARRIDLGSFAEVDYHPPYAERGVTFSTPGGLLHTVEREVPGARAFTRKIEGPGLYPYLDGLGRAIDAGHAPRLVDALNCEWGCNGGPGTLCQGRSPDELEARIASRDRDSRKNYRSLRALGRVLGQFWEKGLYQRGYANLTDQGRVKQPSDQELTEVYSRMAKHEPGDFYNCNSCGYGECHKMAIAVFNHLNKPENCHHYNLEQVKVETTRAQAEEEALQALVDRNATVARDIETAAGKIAEDGRALAEGANKLADLTDQGRRRNTAIAQSLGTLGRSLGDLDAIVRVILDLARRSNLVSINATIEASRAGRTGAAFSVVAQEVKTMAAQTRSEAEKIEPFAADLRNLVEAFTRDLGLTFGDYVDQGAVVDDLARVAQGLAQLAGDLETRAQNLAETAK